MIKQTNSYLTLNQGVLPMFISDCLDICDPVFTFDELIGGLDFDKYLKNVPEHKLGRIGYNPVRMLKTVLFGFMDEGYISLRNLEANANKYTWVWKKATEKSRYRLFEKITTLLNEINADLKWSGLKIETNTEYVPEELKEIKKRFSEIWKIDTDAFVSGRGHRKTVQQRQYEKLVEYTSKLDEYVTKISICGENRNSYSKTDPSATFMRIKTDYMGNDQLLPAYNVQIGVADEYIAVVDVNQYRSDMDCFIPLMNKFYETYGFYPKYPVADAGYGSFNNYIFCEQKGMEGNQYGRKEEVYQCEDCSGCPYASKCKKTDGNRTVRINEELTAMHQEVIDNLESIQGALLRMNRSIQAEGTFGIIKKDRWYKRIVRKGIESVKLEVLLVSIGYNLYKYHNKKMRLQEAA